MISSSSTNLRLSARLRDSPHSASGLVVEEFVGVCGESSGLGCSLGRFLYLEMSTNGVNWIWKHVR